MYGGGGGAEEEEQDRDDAASGKALLPAKRALRAAESCSGCVVLAREMAAPMSFEERREPVGWVERG